MRQTKFANDECYHVCNRGVDKRDVFVNNKDFVRFLTTLREFNTKQPTGELYAQHLRKTQASSNKVTKQTLD